MGIPFLMRDNLEGAVHVACWEEASPVHTQVSQPPGCGSGFLVLGEPDVHHLKAEGIELYNTSSWPTSICISPLAQ